MHKNKITELSTIEIEKIIYRWHSPEPEKLREYLEYLYTGKLKTFTKKILSPEVAGVLNLFAALLNAESGEEVFTVLESVTSPVGTYEKKRMQDRYISINSYAGVTLGFNTDNFVNYNFNNSSFEIFMPVGFELGLKNVGVLISPIDLGSLFKFGFMGDLWDYEANGAGLVKIINENNKDVVNFTSVFAPSFLMVVGWPEFPLNLGLGYQLIPSLKKPENNGYFSIHKFIIFLSIDVVLYLF